MEKAKKTPFGFSWADEVEREEREQQDTSGGRSRGGGMQGPSKRPNPFGEARPREVVLEEKGVDWRMADCLLNNDGHRRDSNLRNEKKNAPRLANDPMEKHKSIMHHQIDDTRTRKELPRSDSALETRMHEGSDFVPSFKYPPKNLMAAVEELHGRNRLHSAQEGLHHVLYPQMFDAGNERGVHGGYRTTGSHNRASRKADYRWSPPDSRTREYEGVTKEGEFLLPERRCLAKYEETRLDISHNLASRKADCFPLPDPRTREYFHHYVKSVTKEEELSLHKRRCLAEFEEIHLTRRHFHSLSYDQRYDSTERVHFPLEYEEEYPRPGVREMKSGNGHRGEGEGKSFLSTRTIADSNQRAKPKHDDSTRRIAPRKERTNRSHPYSSIEVKACQVDDQHRRRGMPSGQAHVHAKKGDRKRR